MMEYHIFARIYDDGDVAITGLITLVSETRRILGPEIAGKMLASFEADCQSARHELEANEAPDRKAPATCKLEENQL